MHMTVDKDVLDKISKLAASHEVKGFLEHDQHHYIAAAENFSKSLAQIFCWKDKDTLREAAEEKVAVLKEHDLIEESDLGSDEKLDSPLWRDKVLPHAMAEANLLGLERDYAIHKVEFYRLHGQGNSGFRDHVYRMDRAFTQGVTGDPRLHCITAPIYLTCIAFHDLRRANGTQSHDGFATKMMNRFYSEYVYNVLRKMQTEC